MFHAIPNDQQTFLQFIDISNTQLADMLLADATSDVFHQTDGEAGPELGGPGLKVLCETAVLLKDKELSQQLTCGTRMRADYRRIF